MEKSRVEKHKPIISVIGSCIIDTIIYTPRIPLIGESLVGTHISTQIGGKASNQAIAIARLGGKIQLVARIGTDEWGSQAVKLWQKEGIDVTNVFRDSSKPTGMGIVVVDKNGQNYTLSVLGANNHLSVEDIASAESAISRSQILSLHLNPPLATVSHALAVAKQFNVTTLLNASPFEMLPKELFYLIDVLLLNQTEVSQLMKFEVNNYHDAFLAGKELIDYGTGAVIISLGYRGLVLVTPTEQHIIPAFKVKAIDTTGAGDALAAGLSVKLAEGQDILSATRFACMVSATSVSRQGTWTAMPTQDEVNSLWDSKLNFILANCSEQKAGNK